MKGRHTARQDAIVRRARAVLDCVILPACVAESISLDVAVAHVSGEPVTYEMAVGLPHDRCQPGAPWGPPWGTAWFHMTGRIPESWSGSRVEARIDLGWTGHPGFGGEGLVWHDGVPVRGLAPEHDCVLVRSVAVGGEPVDLRVEAAANPIVEPGPDPRPRHDPDPGGTPLFRLVRADLVVVDAPVESLAHDLSVLIDLVGVVRGARRDEVVAALEHGLAVLDLDDVTGSAGRTRVALAPALRVHERDADHHVVAVGHAHIDTAWLWPMRESVRKVARTLSTVLALMDEYPEYRFVCSQARQWAWIRDHHPALWERMKVRVAEGRLEPVGAMWVEPDCNLTAGESLIRQLVHGKRFFRDELDVDVDSVWLPDAFGYTPALPQLARQAGCRWFLSQKLSWNDTNAFPHHSFWWEGLDGSRLLAHFPPSDTYNGDMSPGQLAASRDNFRDADVSDRSLYLFGWGDGGGGPTRGMLEAARRVRDLDGVPPVTIGRASEFFAELEALAAPLPVFAGELYLELHRGTYTTQARTKRGNRRCELALRDAELWSALAGARGDEEAWVQLDGLWELLLTNQFHDVLPGTSIARVHEEAERDLAQIEATAEMITEGALTTLVADVDVTDMRQPVVVFNSLSHERREVVAVSGEGPAPGGQRLSDGRTLVAVTVPPCGHAAIDLDRATAVTDGVETTETSVENDLLRVSWDGAGHLVSVYDKVYGREALARPANRLQLHEDRPAQWDAWDIDPPDPSTATDLPEIEEVMIVEHGPLRGAVRMTRRFGASVLEQQIRLAAGSRRLEFVTRVDWQERHRLLRVSFPVAVTADDATTEVAFGVVSRPTVPRSSWDQARFEICAHRFADLSDDRYGVALLNDGKYGHSFAGQVLGLSLLRGSTWPDPDADRGIHHFTYALFPHPGDWVSGGVRQAAHELNSPLRVLAARPGGTAPERGSFLSVDAPNLVVETVKRPYEGSGLVVRLYEAAGVRTRGSLRLQRAVREAWQSDLLEQPVQPLPRSANTVEVEAGPFEVVTVLVR